MPEPHAPAPTDAATQGGQDAETPRVIGGLAGYAIVAGSMLGVGIFILPRQIAEAVGGTTAFFAMWLVGGLFALAGSVACGELGAMLPKAGGDYVFQREAFGPSTAFASGWVLFAAIFAGSIASMSVAVFQYQVSGLVGTDLTADVLGPFSGAQLLAIVLIVLLTALNDAGTRVSAGAQIVLTLLPIAALVVLAGVGLASGRPDGYVAPVSPATELTIGGLAAGFLLVNFAFSGWINIIYVASEVRDPGKNVPRSMIGATFSITGLYLLLCLAFVVVLGFGGVAALGWTDAGTGMANALGSPLLATLVLIIIAVAIVTSVNATVLSSARVAYAMAKGGAFWAGASKLSGARKVPRRALWLQAGLSAILVLSGTFEAIIKMTSIAMFLTGTLTVLAMFALRRQRPELPRPYKASLYPWLPGLYVVFAIAAIIASVWEAFASTEPGSFYPLIGVGVLVVTYVGHLLYYRRARRAAGVVVGLLAAGLLLRQLSEWTLS